MIRPLRDAVRFCPMELVKVSAPANRTLEEDLAVGAIFLVALIVFALVGFGVFIGWLIWA